jgi:hypothetical protein
VNFDAPDRYSILNTIRNYAYDRLAEEKELKNARKRHLNCFLEFSNSTEAKIRGPEQLTWLDRYDAEVDNLRIALETCVLTPEHWREGVALATELIDYWIIRARIAEGHSHFLHLVEAAQEDKKEHCALALSGLASFTRYRELPGYMDLHRRAIELARHVGAPRTLAKVMFSYGYTLVHHLKDEEAEHVFRELLPFAHATDKFLEAFTLISLGDILQNRGELAEAEARYLNALAIRETQGDIRGVGAVTGSLGQIAERRKDFKKAWELSRRCIEAYILVGDRLSLASELASGCCGLWIQGRHHEAAMALACSDELMKDLGTWRDPSDQDVRERWAGRLTEALGQTAYLSAREQGARLSLNDAVNLVLSVPGV